MKTEVVVVDAKSPAPDAIRRAADILLRGGLVAFPTETVYGLGALADDAAAIAKIYAAKGRPSHNPLIAHVTGVEHARRIAASWPEAADRLARAFWPGPLTLVVPRGPSIPRSLSAGLDSMAVRAPQHAVALALLAAVERPVAAPSANPSSRLSPTRGEHVVKGLAGRIDLLLDAGPCAFGIESTVVDVTRTSPRVLRPGSLSLAELQRVVPTVMMGRPVRSGGEPQASPGMDALHYAPRARMVLCPRDSLTATVAAAEPPVGVVTVGLAAGVSGVERVLPAEAPDYGRALFDTLHQLDDAGCRTIVVETVPDLPSWAAIRDRLERGSSS